MARPLRFIAVSQIRPSCKNDENHSYVVVYFKRNLRKDGEAHEQNLAIKPAPHTVLSTNGINFAGAFMATNKSEKKTKQRAGSPKLQEHEKHPAEWRDDMNHERMEGQNIGASSKRNDSGARTAADIDVLAGRLGEFARDELLQIPIAPAGTKLKQGAVYLDMRIPVPVPFAATADIKATEMNYYAPKAEIPCQLWNRLVAALGPAKMGEASKRDEENKPFTPARAAQESALEETRGGSANREISSEPEIDDALADSFPASDPPSWTTGRETKKEPGDETTADDLDRLSDRQLNDKARELNIQASALNREQLILAIRNHS